jgi:integrase
MARIKEIPLRTGDKRVAEVRLRDHIGEVEQESAGILAPKSYRLAALKDLAEHRKDYLADMQALRRSAGHYANTEYRIGLLIKECRWKRLADVTADSFVTWRNRQLHSPKTLNDYLGAASALLNWMKHNERIARNPLESVTTVDTSGEKTRNRRAYTDAEFRRLLKVADWRRMIYMMAAYTGLRRGELGKLLKGDLDLDAPIPVVNVRESISKDGKDASIPLHPDLVAALRELTKDMEEGDLVFPRMPRIERLRRDLKKAGIEYQDAQGRFADFHSFRMTFDTNLQRNGTQPRVVMELMRHSNIRLTMQTYIDASRLPTEAAIKALPSFGATESGPQLGPQDSGTSEGYLAGAGTCNR